MENKTRTKAEAAVVQKYDIVVTQIAKMDRPGRTIREMMGAEFEEYYDGWETDTKANQISFFFYNVPKDKADVAITRMTAFPFMKIDIEPMEN